MPIYEYRCQSCGHDLEKLQRLSDEHLKDCPSCGKPDLKRLISAAGFRLKGGGWYETDFKSGNKRNLADSGDKASKGDGESKSGSGSEKSSGESSRQSGGKSDSKSDSSSTNSSTSKNKDSKSA